MSPITKKLTVHHFMYKKKSGDLVFLSFIYFYFQVRNDGKIIEYK